MSLAADKPRVAYVVSADLVRYADRLPSNEGRSSLVHSLAYHLDLLDLSELDESEATDLRTAVHADPSSSSSSNVRRALVYPPTPATRQQLTSYHEESFVDQLLNSKDAGKAEHSRKRLKLDSDGQGAAPSDTDQNNPHQTSSKQFGLSHDCPPFPGLPSHISLVAGASITAANLLSSGECDIAICWDGGRHHARKSSASGFCYVNDVVLAILALRKPRKVVSTTMESGEEVKKTKMKRIDRILYLDLDLHWGDGVEEAFFTSPHVLTLSIHHYAPGFFPCYSPSIDPSKWGPPGSLTADPGTARTSLNIPLGLGTGDDSLERILSSTVEPLVEAWAPEVVVVQCGVDGLAGDPMGVWNLSSAAYVGAIQRVLSWKKPTLLLGGGGYQSENAARVSSLLTAACLGRFEEGSNKRHAEKKVDDEPVPLTEQNETPQKKVDRQGTEGGGRVGFDTPIPEHEYWPQYGPEYTLGVAAGEMIDQNDEAHFEAVQRVFENHIKDITISK